MKMLSLVEKTLAALQARAAARIIDQWHRLDQEASAPETRDQPLRPPSRRRIILGTVIKLGAGLAACLYLFRTMG